MSDAHMLEDWFTRFAAGAGTLFVWEVTKEGYLVAYVGDWLAMCPLSAQATVEAGTFYGRGDYLCAGDRQGLPRPLQSWIADAADEEGGPTAPYRARLLRICRIKGTTA